MGLWATLSVDSIIKASNKWENRWLTCRFCNGKVFVLASRIGTSLGVEIRLQHQHANYPLTS